MATHQAYQRALEQRDACAREVLQLKEALAEANTDALLLRVKELGETNEKLRAELADTATRVRELATIGHQLNDRLLDVTRENARLKEALDKEQREADALHATGVRWSHERNVALDTDTVRAFLAGWLDESLARLVALCARALAGDQDKRSLVRTLRAVLERAQSMRCGPTSDKPALRQLLPAEPEVSR